MNTATTTTTTTTTTRTSSITAGPAAATSAAAGVSLLSIRAPATTRCESAAAPFASILRLAVNPTCWWEASEEEADGGAGIGGRQQQQQQQRQRPIDSDSEGKPVSAHWPELSYHTHANWGLARISQALRLIVHRSGGGGGGVEGMDDVVRCGTEGALALDSARQTLSRWGRIANTRAFFVVNTLPRALRDRILILVGASYRTHGGICCAEAYEQMLRLRHELLAFMMTSQQPERGETTLACDEALMEEQRISQTLTLFEEQGEIQACIHAHRVASAACASFGEYVTHMHRMCPCGGCCFSIGTQLLS